ncbi:hypothetical protein NPIL_466391 [Nephila pilipes]|uniref:Uncharacterized protein n=1 Tax=Nephila pilipes TaxID=299642 RepID=A0A8X6NLP1_NEPPI|nr:hypothetical protein NPIL_680451 [Nephila pilipes]GFT86709.1 hypothetical protein NPIL_466391 [Nephila pilipes]
MVSNRSNRDGEGHGCSQTCLSQRSASIALTDRYYTLLNMDYELCPPPTPMSFIDPKDYNSSSGDCFREVMKELVCPPLRSSFESFDW